MAEKRRKADVRNEVLRRSVEPTTDCRHPLSEPLSIGKASMGRIVRITEANRETCRRADDLFFEHRGKANFPASAQAPWRLGCVIGLGISVVPFKHVAALPMCYLETFLAESDGASFALTC